MGMASFGGLVLLGVAHRPDDLFHVPDLRDAEPEILADLHRLTDADHLVVDEQLQRLVAALEELDDRARAEAHDFREVQLSLGQLHDDGDFQAQDAVQFGLRRRRGRGGGVGLGGFGLKDGQRTSLSECEDYN